MAVPSGAGLLSQFFERGVARLRLIFEFARGLATLRLSPALQRVSVGGHLQGLAAGVLAKLWMRVSKP